MELIPRGVSPPLGNETKADSAVPVYDACKLCLYSTVSRASRGASAILMPALWLAAVAAACALRRRHTPDGDRSTDGLVTALLLVLTITVLAMIVALLGEGEFEIVKHLYLASFGNALLSVLAVHAAGLLLAGRSSDASRGAIR